VSKILQPIENQTITTQTNKQKLTKEQIIEIAKTCQNKQEFYVKHKKLYDYCTYKGFRKEVMLHIPHKKKWTETTLLEEAKKFRTRSQWLKNSTSSYNIAFKDKAIFDRCVEHMIYHGKFGDPNTIKYSYESCKEIYEQFNSITDLIKENRNVYSASIRNGWHKEFSKHMSRYKGYNVKWTFERVKEEASKYNSISEFKNNNRGAYFKAVYSKWLLDVIGHMTGGNKKWTVEKLVEVLAKHDSKKWYKVNECKAAFAYMKRHNLTKYIMKKIYVSNQSNPK